MSNSTLNGKQERKKLRKAQREVSDQMIVDKDELDKPDSDVWNIHRNRNNELKEKVLHARELLNDSQNVKALAQSVQNAAGHLDDISRRYDFTSFAASLTRQYNSGTTGLFSWVGFGQDVGVLSRRRECLCTMFGPVGKEVVAKAARKERMPKESHNEKVVAQVVSNTEDDGESEATNLRIKHLNGLVMEEKSFDLLDLLVDRVDPVQSVENFFDFAFLIKEKKVSQELVKGKDDPCRGLVLSRPMDSNILGGELAAKQQVLSMPIEDMRTVAELMADIDELTSRGGNGSSSQRQAIPKLRSTQDRNVLHRDDPLYMAENASQQADILTQQSRAKQEQGQQKASSSSSSSSATASNGSTASAGKRKKSTQKKGVVPRKKKKGD